MRKLYIPFYFLLYFSILPNLSFAQIIGGDITYSCIINDSTYLVELRVYSDADDGNPILDTINYSSLACGIDSSLKLLLVSTTPVSLNCPALINVEERLFRDTLILPNFCDDWVLSYETCCRSNAITSGAAIEGFYISSMLDNQITPCNNSPVFGTPGLIYTCDNAPVTYQTGGMDSYGDSLVYSIVNCTQSSNNSSVTYNMGLSGSQPISTTSGITIDPETGEVNFTPTADITQIAPICIQVEEYRNGVKIGEINRDILIVSNLAIAPVPVPTLGQWGIITMILLFLIVGITVLNSDETTEYEIED